MKEKIIKVANMLGLVVVLVYALSAWTENQAVSEEPRLITVTGDAEVRVIPDEVILTLGVETWDKDLDVAKGQNDKIVAKALALASDYGIDPAHIQTDYVNIEPRYRNGYYEPRDFVGFFVRKTIVITLRDITQFEDLLASALGAGVNHVQGIEFRTTELRKYRDEARALAIRAAREKASALAGELGQAVGDPRTIHEEQSGWRSTYSAWWGILWGQATAQNVIQEVSEGALTAGSSLAPGQISVNASVSVSFELTD